jgi:uncharacterized metal-binding protein YceD (DUF177 family)
VTPELSRPFPVERVGEGIDVLVTPTPAERAAVAARMGLVELSAFTCNFALQRAQNRNIRATGQLRAVAIQTCVVSLEPFEAVIAEDFAVRFVPEGTESEDLNIDAEDEIPYAGTMLDLGEAASEQLALALDPFPRKAGVSLPEEAEDAPEGAFAALRRLREPE